jgi:transcriptional regulator with XRE-family HTH domain
VEASEAARRSIRTLASIFPEFGERIKARMRHRRLSFPDLAKATGISRPTLYRLAGDIDANPTLKNLVSLSEALGTTVSHLLVLQKPSSRRAAGSEPSLAAFFGEPPRGDPRSMDIYEALSRAMPEKELERHIRSLSYLLPGETIAAAITRSVLDVFHHQLAWIDPERLERDRDQERRIQDCFDLPDREELAETVPARVIKLPAAMVPIMKIHALASMTAQLIKALLGTYSTLGLADGFSMGLCERFIRRGDLSRAELVPLTHTPQFVHYEFSGPTLLGAMTRTHHGYQVGSKLELSKLQERIRQVQVAVTSCGSMEPETHGRLAQLMPRVPGKPAETYSRLIENYKKMGVVGDLLYHFLKSNGEVFPPRDPSRYLERMDARGLARNPPKNNPPPIYAVSPDGLADIASRGVAILMVHTVSRAAVARAALVRTRRPINFVVISDDAAEALLDMGGGARRKCSRK